MKDYLQKIESGILNEFNRIPTGTLNTKALSITPDKSGITFTYDLYKIPKNNIDISNTIKKVIFNDPATIVFWKDGTKTVVKCENEAYDPEKGLAMAISKRVLGDKGHYYETFKKWLPKDNTKAAKHTNNWIAYNRLANALHDKKATKHDLYVAIQEAIGYLGEVLE